MHMFRAFRVMRSILREYLLAVLAHEQSAGKWDKKTSWLDLRLLTGGIVWIPIRTGNPGAIRAYVLLQVSDQTDQGESLLEDLCR